MSSPSLLEYHLISRRPIAWTTLQSFTHFKVRSRVPHGTRITPLAKQASVPARHFFFTSLSLVEDLMHCLSSYRCSWSFIFSKLSCGTVSAIFVGHVLADYNLKPINIAPTLQVKVPKRLHIAPVVPATPLLGLVRIPLAYPIAGTHSMPIPLSHLESESHRS